jgi:hypothetical protein
MLASTDWNYSSLYFLMIMLRLFVDFSTTVEPLITDTLINEHLQ